MKYLFFALIIAGIIWVLRSGKFGASGMSASEAAKILELSPDAGVDAIQAAHRRLIAKVHPDAGGSADLAARVNEARDVLLKRLTR
jgi:DnaJ homolog subfamily C member 19